LTVIYSTESPSAKPMSRPTSMVPLLVLLFIVSYSVLAALVFEQGRTIESQRSLIREMLKDSNQLAALKDKLARNDGKHAQDRVQDKAALQADRQNADSGNSAAATQGSPAKESGAKGLDKQTKRPGKSAHTTKTLPERPAADLEDVRRSTNLT